MSQEKMALDDELELLKKRRAELKTISCNLEDIFDWFRSNKLAIRSHLTFSGLEFAISEVDIVVAQLKDAIDSLEERLQKEADK